MRGRLKGWVTSAGGLIGLLALAVALLLMAAGAATALTWATG